MLRGEEFHPFLGGRERRLPVSGADQALAPFSKGVPLAPPLARRLLRHERAPLREDSSSPGRTLSLSFARETDSDLHILPKGVQQPGGPFNRHYVVEDLAQQERDDYCHEAEERHRDACDGLWAAGGLGRITGLPSTWISSNTSYPLNRHNLFDLAPRGRFLCNQRV